MQQKASGKAAPCCLMQCSIAFYPMEKYIVTCTLVHVSPGKGNRQQKGLYKSWSWLVGRALFSKVPAAGAMQHTRLCLSWVLGLRTNTSEGPCGSATLSLPLTCQKPGDASGSKVKLSSSCLLVLYCTSFACCYSKNRTDSSSGGTTTVNKTTQANSLLNICSLWVRKAHRSAREQTQHDGDHHWCGAVMSLNLNSQSHQNTTDQLKICSLEAVATGKLEHPPFPKQEVVALYYSL